MTVAVLCSGFGLGHYVPGLLISNGLQRQRIQTKVFVFENLMLEHKREKVAASRQAYGADFAMARLAQRIPFDMRESLENQLVDELLEQWVAEDLRQFVCLSGHWVYVLDRYREKRFPVPIQADLVQMDSELAPSWKGLKKHCPGFADGYQVVWLLDSQANEINYSIRVTDKEPIAYQRRPDRYLIHGGGWGMSTHREKLLELEAQGLALDVLIYDAAEAGLRPGNRYFMVRPDWSPWHRKEGKHIFPPLGEVTGAEAPVYVYQEQNHRLFDVAREAKAIISKPGGGTLMDSLASATPLVMLEPLGVHEEQNAAVWQALGLGISYDAWRETGFSQQTLQSIHENLQRKRQQVADYSTACAHRIGRAAL